MVVSIVIVVEPHLCHEPGLHRGVIPSSESESLSALVRPRCRSGWEIGNWELGNVFNPWSCFTKLISHFSYSAIFYEEADNVVMTWVIVSDICFITSIHIYNPVENITISYILTQPWIFWIITVFILKISKKFVFKLNKKQDILAVID